MFEGPNRLECKVGNAEASLLGDMPLRDSRLSHACCFGGVTFFANVKTLRVLGKKRVGEWGATSGIQPSAHSPLGLNLGT